MTCEILKQVQDDNIFSTCGTCHKLVYTVVTCGTFASCGTFIYMTATGHAVIGTVIAASITNPWVAAPLAILSHLAADISPHWDLGTNAKKKTKQRLLYETVGDVLFGFLVSYLLIIFVFPQTNLGYAFIMIILAQGFDWAWAPEYFFKIKNPISHFSLWMGKIFDNKQDKPWGIINQVGILVLLIIIAKYFA